MAARGQKPKNANIRLVEGNRGRRPINMKEARKLGKPKMPKWVPKKGYTRELWDNYSVLLYRVGMIRETDSEALAAWCALTDEFSKDPTAFNAAKLTQMRMYAEQLGLTPAGRARIVCDVPDEEEIPSEENKTQKPTGTDAKDAEDYFR